MRLKPTLAALGDPMWHRSSVRSSSLFHMRVVALAAVLTMSVVACSSASSTTTTTVPAVSSTTAVTTTTAAATTTTAAPTTTTAATTTTTTQADTSALAGSWSGNYDGTYQGTFDLSWQQSGSALTGTITLSSMAGALPVNGTVDGDNIEFGTVGSQQISYSGSISGDSMSGTYEIGGGQGSGSWSATKAS